MAKIGVEDLSHNIFDHLGQKSQNIQFTLHGGRPSVRCIFQVVNITPSKVRFS